MSTDLHTLSGAYAINALSPAEAEDFATHLDECPACRDEVRELQEAAARMGASEATAPPSALKARILAAADQQPQLPPKVVRIEEHRRRRWAPRIAGLAAAAVLLAAAVVGIGQLRDGEEPPVAANQVSEVFDAPDAHVASVTTADGNVLKVATSPDAGRMALETKSLGKLKDEQVYQMWARHNKKVTSIGLIDDLDDGKVMPIPTYGTSVTITVEPEGGSRKPTGSRIMPWMDPQAI
jgi:anti-sigma-K factor RskA